MKSFQGTVLTVLIGLGIGVGAVGMVRTTFATSDAPVDGTAVVIDTNAIGALRHPDAATLNLWSEAAGVPTAFTYAMAWEETRNNDDPSVRGMHGELGRFQIKLSTARLRCPGLNVADYYDNLACFLRMTRQDWQSCGSWRCAARKHNGSGAAAEAYAKRVLSTVRVIVNSKIGPV